MVAEVIVADTAQEAASALVMKNEIRTPGGSHFVDGDDLVVGIVIEVAGGDGAPGWTGST